MIRENVRKVSVEIDAVVVVPAMKLNLTLYTLEGVSAMLGGDTSVGI